MSAAPNPSSFHLRPQDVAWADEVSARLRLILATAADEKRADRAVHLESEVRRSLESVAPAERGRYLERLAERFPTDSDRGSLEGASVPVRPASSPAAAAAPAPATPESALDLLLDAWPHCTPDEQAAMRSRLAAAGILDVRPKAAANAGGGEFETLRQRIVLAAGDGLDHARLEALIVQLVEFFVKLDQLVWNTWRALAPRSGLKRDSTLGDLRLQLRRHLKGDAEPSEAQITQQIERARQLMAVLLGSMSQVGRGFVNRYHMRFSPDAVRDLVKAEGGGSLLTGIDTRCWRKYADLAAEINESTIQNDMQEVIVKYVEDLMRGTSRPTN